MSLTFEYKQLVKKILSLGVKQEGRNGNTLVIPHYSFTLDHSYSDQHTLKLRKMFYKGVQGEFDTLIDPTPLTNVSQFKANGCNYWEKWGDKDGNINVDYHNKLHPQLLDVINGIISNPSSRRHVVDLWDHDLCEIDKLSLPCCWNQLVFSVIDGYLHMTWTQRSVDTMIGLPADIYLSVLFMEYVANITNLKVGSCMYSLSNVHIYESHIPNAQILLGRTEEDFDKKLDFELKE